MVDKIKNIESPLQLIGPFAQVITMAGLPLKGAIKEQALEIIGSGGVVVSGTKIMNVGVYSELKALYPNIDKTIIETPQVLLPGFVDAHTHICFAGSREMDYAMRLEGKTYLEIAEAGGGIMETVTATRKASQQELTNSVHERLDLMLRSGVTTTEIKTGYGLSIGAELKLLDVIQQVAVTAVLDIIPTCLAAHIKPADFKGDEQAYLALIATKLFPEMLKERSCKRVDIFVEKSAFSVADARRYLSTAKQQGFDLTVHADQFSTGGGQLAVALGAISADHLEASGPLDIAALARSETVATVLPGASIGLGMDFAPARKLLDAGACLAIASDWNPGSAPMGNLPVAACILSAYERLSMCETLAGISFRAAHALGLKDRGRLQKGFLADMQAYAFADYREICYHQGQTRPVTVWKKGIAYDQR